MISKILDMIIPLPRYNLQIAENYDTAIFLGKNSKNLQNQNVWKMIEINEVKKSSE